MKIKKIIIKIKKIIMKIIMKIKKIIMKIIIIKKIVNRL
jgi:hypothetical protein